MKYMNYSFYGFLVVIFFAHGMQYRGYPDEPKIIPLQGYSFAIRFATYKQIMRMIGKVKWLPSYGFSPEDDVDFSPSVCGCVQIRASGAIMDLLFKMAELSGDDHDQFRSFLRENSFSIVPLSRAAWSLAYLSEHDMLTGAQVVLKHNPGSKMVSWEPDYYVPLYGRIKTKFIYFNDDFSVVFVRPRSGAGMIGTLFLVQKGRESKPFCVRDLDEFSRLIAIAYTKDPLRTMLLANYPEGSQENLAQISHSNSGLAQLTDELCNQ